MNLEEFNNRISKISKIGFLKINGKVLHQTKFHNNSISANTRIVKKVRMINFKGRSKVRVARRVKYNGSKDSILVWSPIGMLSLQPPL